MYFTSILASTALAFSSLTSALPHDKRYDADKIQCTRYHNGKAGCNTFDVYRLVIPNPNQENDKNCGQGLIDNLNGQAVAIAASKCDNTADDTETLFIQVPIDTSGQLTRAGIAAYGEPGISCSDSDYTDGQGADFTNDIHNVCNPG